MKENEINGEKKWVLLIPDLLGARWKLSDMENSQHLQEYLYQKFW